MTDLDNRHKSVFIFSNQNQVRCLKTTLTEVITMEPNRPLVTQKELISPDAGTKKNWDLFEDMLKQTDELIKSGKLK